MILLTFILAVIAATGFLVLGRRTDGKRGGKIYNARRGCPKHPGQYRTSCPCTEREGG